MLTPILAEIADKMGTPIEMWLFSTAVAAIAGKPTVDVPLGTLNSILKQAGLK